MIRPNICDLSSSVRIVCAAPPARPCLFLQAFCSMQHVAPPRPVVVRVSVYEMYVVQLVIWSFGVTVPYVYFVTASPVVIS